jgi:hypothetical protein
MAALPAGLALHMFSSANTSAANSTASPGMPSLPGCMCRTRAPGLRCTALRERGAGTL